MALLVAIVNTAAGLGSGDRHRKLCNRQVAPRVLPLGPLLIIMLIGRLLLRVLLGFSLCMLVGRSAAHQLLSLLLLLPLMLLLAVRFTRVAAARRLLHFMLPQLPLAPRHRMDVDAGAVDAVVLPGLLLHLPTIRCFAGVPISHRTPRPTLVEKGDGECSAEGRLPDILVSKVDGFLKVCIR